MRTEIVAVVIAGAALLDGPAAALQADNPYGGGTRLTGPAPAEIPTGSMSQQDKARIVTQRLAACLIKDHRETVAKAIEPEPWETGAEKQLGTVVDARCLEGGELSMPSGLLRGAFYQEFYREAFASGPPVLPASALDFTAGSANLPESAKTEVALRQFGDCVIRRDLQDSHALVLSTPGSAKENLALGNLMPHFSACVVQGSNWTLNRSSVSAVLSEVLYREGMVARQGRANPSTGKSVPHR